jgi:hypothetical protein
MDKQVGAPTVPLAVIKYDYAKTSKKRGLDSEKNFVISANRPCDDQIYNCNLEILPTQAIIKRNCPNWSKHTKVTSLPKTVQPL